MGLQDKCCKVTTINRVLSNEDIVNIIKEAGCCAGGDKDENFVTNLINEAFAKLDIAMSDDKTTWDLILPDGSRKPFRKVVLDLDNEPVEEEA